MTRPGADLAEAVMGVLLGSATVTKAAGGGLMLPAADVQIAVSAMAEAFLDAQQQQNAQLRKVVKAMKQTLREAQAITPAAPRGLMPYRPQEWRTELRPAFPPRRMNGHGSSGAGGG